MTSSVDIWGHLFRAGANDDLPGADAAADGTPDVGVDDDEADADTTDDDEDGTTDADSDPEVDGTPDA